MAGVENVDPAWDIWEHLEQLDTVCCGWVGSQLTSRTPSSWALPVVAHTFSGSVRLDPARRHNVSAITSSDFIWIHGELL